MRKANSWHPDYAAEACARSERDAHQDLTFVKYASSTYQVLPLVHTIAAETGDSKLASIAATVSEIEQEREEKGNRCYRKVTEAQRHVLATALLKKYGSARGVVKAAWNVTDAQIEDADI